MDKDGNIYDYISRFQQKKNPPLKILTTVTAVFGKFYTVEFQRVATCNVQRVPYHICYFSLIAMLRVDVLCVGSIRASMLTVLLLVWAVLHIMITVRLTPFRYLFLVKG